nr:transglutaminase-like domain-containing protein [Thermococcus sp. Bubb.Bath]
MGKTNVLSQTLPTSTSTYTSTQASSITSESHCSDGYWRYIFEDALKCALTEEKLSKVTNLASQQKGKSLQESAWNILEWLHKNIEYNYSKASLPDPIIWTSNGKITRIDATPGVEIQTPYETIQRGAGVCKDYAILTAALLLEMNYSPIYVFSIEFENSRIGHTAVAIKLNGEYFILDQNPPVMDLGTYYTDWSVYRQETLGERLFISNATIYEISKDKNGATVKKVGILSAEDFKRNDHAFSSEDLSRISTDLKKTIEEGYPNLISDSNIADLDERSYLPSGYSGGTTWKMTFPHYADFYNPLFHKQFVEYLFAALTDDKNIKRDLKGFNRFWIKLEQEGDSLKVTLNLAKK